MKKSIALFSSGALIGAIAAASLFYYSGSSVDKLRSATLTPSSPAMAQVQKELSTILAKLELISTGVDSLAYNTYPTAMNSSGQVPAQAAAIPTPKPQPMPNMMPQDNATPPAMQSAAASPPRTPTAPDATQIEQYNSIKYRIYEAANNPTAKLSDLMKMGKDLTPEQRQELTNEVMAMIKRGELSEKQFTASP